MIESAAALVETLLTRCPPPVQLPPWQQRLTSNRTGTRNPIVLNAVIFRASDTNLTPAGIYLDMAARLLALAVLAIRGRVKR